VESDLLIDFLKGVMEAKSALESTWEEGLIHLSAVSATEVMAASREGLTGPSAKLIESFGIVPVDKEVALLAGRYLSEDPGNKLELGDCIVAATCRKLAAVLVTRGRRAYPADGFETRIVKY
jgi:predicted nucleic acid-binding protein